MDDLFLFQDLFLPIRSDRSAHLRQTLEKWENNRYASIPVLNRKGEYVGTLTEGDILWGLKNTMVWIWKRLRMSHFGLPAQARLQGCHRDHPAWIS